MIKVASQKRNGKEQISENPLLVSLEYVADKLSVSTRTVRRNSQLGKLPPIKKVGHSARMYWPDVQVYINRLFGKNGEEVSI